MKKQLIAGMMIVGLSLTALTGCFAPKPTATVEDFMTAIQEKDFEKAATFVDPKGSEDFDFKSMSEEAEAIDGFDPQVVFDGISNGYKFENPEEVKNEGDTAQVKVKVTSIDFAAVMTSVMGEVMPMAFGMAFSEDEAAAEKAMDKMMMTSLKKHLNAEDASMATRTVTLNLKKDKDGEYKILSDDQLMDAVLANASEIEEIFGQ
ncbi:DUF5105 domain-containing protein [Mesobacillus foraminis]|uniref:DUF5105 domain-containing protein n=1 Tax=Mesobacillus foraminis TaxID=279826 RepID=UPI000EF5455C|nr:DUF5105 domain-containing protein [Mesobacillus foraminis]